MHSDKPLIALTLGDPAGIGPEIAEAASRDAAILQRMRLLLIGPESLRPGDVPPVLRDATGRLKAAIDGRAWLATPAPERWEMGRVQQDCGRAAVEALRAGHELASSSQVAALVTCPVNKAALHLAGERVEGQTELLGRWCERPDCEMLAIAGNLRVMLLTRHMPLRKAIESVTTERVLKRLILLDQTLRSLGFARPRLALAGLNPHAGEGGLLGQEDGELLRPAVEAACARGLRVEGPVSPDSVFARASRGDFEGVLALYHDQAFIPIKLLAADAGVTVIAGLPYLRVSPVHGTAFEIAGKGIASPTNLIAALQQAAAWTSPMSPGIAATS